MLYAEDLETGVEVAFGTWTFTEDAIVEYASQWDPLPIHTDAVAARAGPFGQLIASGLHTMAVDSEGNLLLEVTAEGIVLMRPAG